MKRLFTAILPAMLFLGFNIAYAQNSVSNDGGMIKFQTFGGPDANAYYIPATKATNKVLIVFHEWYGLTENIKQQARDWANKFDGSVAVYAVDLYDGKTTTEKFAAGKMMNNLDAIRTESIVKGLLTKIGSGKQIATLGWGMGGTWAFKTAAFAGTSAAGCVMYYSYPVTDDNIIKQFKTDVIFMYSNQDEYIQKKDVENFGQKVTSAGRGFNLNTFNAINGFANIGNEYYTSVETNETTIMSYNFLLHKFGL